jgi:hypothetical protein
MNKHFIYNFREYCKSNACISSYFFSCIAPRTYTVIRFVLVSAKFGTCTVVSVNGTLGEDKMRRFKGECAHFSFNKCPIYTHDGASAKFSTIPRETDNSVLHRFTASLAP